MVDERTGAELPDREEPGTLQVVAVGVAAVAGPRDVRGQREPREAVARQEPLGGQIAVRIEVAHHRLAVGRAVQQQVRLGLRLASAGAGPALLAGRQRVVDDPLVLLVLVHDGRPEQLPPPVEGRVELLRGPLDPVLDPLVVPPRGRLEVPDERGQYGPGGRDRAPAGVLVEGQVVDVGEERQRHVRIGAVAAVRVVGDVDDVRDRPAELHPGLRQPDALQMGADQVLVGQVQTRRGHLSGHHVLGAAEVVLVVAVARGAVRGHECGLAGTARPARALRVVRRGRRDVAHHHGVERGDVHAQLHRRRAVQQGQFGGAELPLALQPVLRSHLRGVLPGEQARQLGRRRPVQVPEERVDPRPLAAVVRARQRVDRAPLAVPGPPDEGGGRHPEPHALLGRPAAVGRAGVLRGRLHLTHQVRFAQHLQQVLDDALDVLRGEVAQFGQVPPQVLAELATGRQEQRGTLHTRPRAVRVGGADGGAVALAQHPRTREALLARPLQGVEVVAEVLHVDGEGAPHEVQQRPGDLLTQRGVRVAERRVDGIPAVRLGGDPAQVLVIDAQQPRLLQVRHRDAPAALQVAVEPVPHDVTEGLRRTALHRGSQLAVLRVRRVLAGRQPHHLGHGLGQVVVAQPLLAGPHRGLVEGTAQLGHLREVVEVPGLERRVLPVVDEGEELARLLAQAFLRHRTQGLHDRRGDQGGRRGTPFLVEGGELGEVPAAGLLVGDLAVHAEQERRRHERRHQTLVGLVPEAVHDDALGHPGAIGLLDDGHTLRVPFEPRLRQPPVVHGLLRIGGPLVVLPGHAQVQITLAVAAPGGRGVPARLVPERAALLGAPDGQVLLTALAAERQREQRLAGAAGLLQLVGAGEGSGERIFQRRVDGVALGEELVQPEGEQRAFRHRVLRLRTGLQGGADRLAHTLLGHTRGVGQLPGRRLQGARGTPAVPPRALLALQTEPGLHPAGQRVLRQRVVRAGGRRNPQPLGGHVRRGLLGRPDEGLADDPLRQDRRTEQPAGDPGHLAPLVLPGPLGRHGRRGADALQGRRGPAGLADPADQERHVRALPAAVGVQLVEDQELQSLGHADQAGPVVRPGQHQLQHHVVRQQDVRRVLAQLPTLFVGLLPGVTGEGDRLAPRPETVAQVLLQLAELRVGQRVHRVDHDRADPPASAGAGRLTFLQDAVHDRDDVRQGLAGTGARGQDVGVTRLRGLDRLPLVEVEGQRTAVRAPRVLLLARLEDLRAPGVQHAVPHEVGDLAAVGEEGIERQPRIGPL